MVSENRLNDFDWFPLESFEDAHMDIIWLKLETARI